MVGKMLVEQAETLECETLEPRLKKTAKQPGVPGMLSLIEDRSRIPAHTHTHTHTQTCTHTNMHTQKSRKPRTILNFF